MIALPIGARAQTAPAEDPPAIVVTAPSAADRVMLRDSPVNDMVLSGDALNRQHPASLADLLDATQGSASLSNGTGNPYQNDVAIRGFQATSSLGAATGLSVWQDGVRLNEPFGGNVNWDLIAMNAVGSVAVLPGSNPLFGLNTLGGALVLTTKNGADNPGAAVTVQGGSFARRAAMAQAGGTAANKQFDWFVAGDFDEQDGYRWYTHSRVARVFAKLRWHDAVNHAELSVSHADTTLNGTQGLPVSQLAQPQSAYTWPDTVANRQTVANLVAGGRFSEQFGISGNVYLRWSDARALNSNASLGDGCDAPCAGLAPGGTAIDRDAATGYAGSLPLHDYTGAINTTLVGSGIAQRSVGGNVLIDRDVPLAGLRNDFNLGGSFEQATIGYDQHADLARLVAYQVVPLTTNARYAGVPADPRVNTIAITSHTSAFTLFVRDMVTLTPTLSVTGSLSWTSTRVSLRGTRTTLLGDDGGYNWADADGTMWYNPAYLGAHSWDAATGQLATAGVPDGALAGPQSDAVVGTHRYSRINPALGLTWNPRARIGLFASVSQAMRAPTAIELACADPARPCALPTGFNGDPDLRAVVAHSLELGVRGRIGRRIGFNAAAYRTRVTNDIQFVFAPSGLGHFANLGQTERQGFELALTADWTRVQLSASYGHVAAHTRDAFVDAQGDLVVPGARIAGIPAQSLKLAMRWQPARDLRLGANLTAVSDQVAHGDEAARQPPVPGYALVAVDAKLMPWPGLELFATVTNLFDRRYATFGVLGGNVYTGGTEQFRTPAPGRALLAGVTWRFGQGERRAD
ncbi:TonB-dependent receptor [Novosphingobium sp.]|uniref:TonB-dependent receptor n=1 Tax=Novosphingobium sp. TaxID=1874826 RepID=UPI00334192EF